MSTKSDNKSKKDILTPDIIYGDLFFDVQSGRIFPDNKTFVDCIPKKDPKQIVSEYLKIKKKAPIDFSLEKFVYDNFEIPAASELKYSSNEKDIHLHLKNLWKVLKREKDVAVPGSSLLPLPYSYIVPGGRFREIYYWDSFFTMLGLKESGEYDLMHNMVKNFAFLIDTYGHIPNGNRTYYLSRSQPPYFSQMIELLAQVENDLIYTPFLSALENEYQYWMHGSGDLKNGELYRRAVKFPDGTILNRYWDDNPVPRQESYVEDVETANEAVNNFQIATIFKDAEKNQKASDDLRKKVYQDLRAGAESGWDFSSRWFHDGKKIATIQTTDIIPVDLNCLIYHLEKTLAVAYRQGNDLEKSKHYKLLSEARQKAINKYFWSREAGWYYDYDTGTKNLSTEMTLAGITPYFLNVADKSTIIPARKTIQNNFLKPGGVVTTLKTTGQQWDAPNGWAPLQWMTIRGFENYGEMDLAKNIAVRWIRLNSKVFENTGKLMEKYNVENLDLDAGGGEYPSQDGFGWTNGVLLALMKKYNPA